MLNSILCHRFGSKPIIAFFDITQNSLTFQLMEAL